MKVSLVPTELIDGLRGWFHPKDRSVVLANNCFIEGQEIVTPGTPVAGRRRLYAKSGCWYDLGSNGTETGLCVSGVDPAGHTHSKIVASDGAPDPALSADASGYLAAAVTPLVSAYVSNTITNVTGDGTIYTVIYDTEVVDRNSNYNTANGVFTAPVTSKYLVVFDNLLAQVGAAHVASQSAVVTSNRNYNTGYCNPYAMSNSGFTSVGYQKIVDMDAGDTMSITVSVTGGTKVVDIWGGAVYSSLQIYQLP